MPKIMGFYYSPRPKDWVRAWWLALSNTVRGIGDLFSNKRLWVGVAVSVLLHGLIFFLSLDLTGRRVSTKEGENIDVAYDPTLPPKAQQLVQQEQFMPSGTTDESAPIDLSKNKVSFQSQIDVDEFSLDQGQASLTGDVIRINPNARLSTEDILASAPIDISRSLGGTGAQNPFDQIASGAGSSIELDSKATQIGSQVEKPKFDQGDAGSGKDAADAAGSGAKKSGFALTGDLSRGDIVSSAMPPYPPWARQKGLTNVTVSIRFAVDAAGNVLSTMIVAKSTGYPNWDSTVKSALARWKFKPGQGKRNGTITFRFILN
jgi:TonB family protein